MIVCLRPTPRPATSNFLPITQTANLSIREKKRRAKQDPYAWAQAQQRKNANLKRRAELEKERAIKHGADPINGKVTPFLESLEFAGQRSESKVPLDAEGNPLKESHPLPTSKGLRNHFLTDQELESAMEDAYKLTRPYGPGPISEQTSYDVDQGKELAEHKEKHARAVEAMRRITDLANGSARDTYHANVRRIVDEFGRHKTDKYLEKKPLAYNDPGTAKPLRSGPDTGSSEVQIAILTAKIQKVNAALGTGRGYKDTANRRNLELLVHRRQKLLRYMERKERGGARWTNLLEKLGITEAMWKGQITSYHVRR